MDVDVLATSDIDGGAEGYLRALYTGAAAHGVQARLLGRIPAWPMGSLDVGAGGKWGRATLLQGLRELPSLRRRVHRAIAVRQPDLVHAQFKREQLALSGVARRHAPVVWTEHGRFLGGVSGRLLAQGYARASRHVDLVICVSDEVRRDVEAICDPGPRGIVTVRNAVDVQRHPFVTTEQRRAARTALGLPYDRPVVCVVSRLHAEKRVGLAIAAAGLAGTTLLVAGDGPQRSALEAAAGEADIRFLGWVEDPRAVYAASDGLLFTSTGVGEGYPTLATLEAAAAGVPIVTVEGSGFEPYAEEFAGVVVPADPRELAAVIRDRPDEDARRRMRSWAERHGTGPWLQRHVELFRSVITAASP